MHSLLYRKEMQQITLKEGDILTARTKDGLGMNLTLSFQYRLKISLSNIVGLYFKWGPKGFSDAFNRMSRSVL